MTDDWARGERSFAAIREKVAVMVATGRLGFPEILEGAYHDLVGMRGDPEQYRLGRDNPRDLGATEVYDIVDRAFAGHLRRQRKWPVRTDVERLERARQALAGLGIPVFEAVECCDGCLEHLGGESYLWELAEEQDPEARTVVYFYDSDIELALLGGGLWMAFSAGGEGRTGAAAAEILEVLHAHGLDAHWPDDEVPRIRVDMEWCRRRHGRLAAHPGPCATQEPVVRVGFSGPPLHTALPWWGEFHELESSVREFARLALPWLPTGLTVAVTSLITGSSICLQRDFDRIRVLGTGRLLPRKHLDEILSRWAVDGSLPSEDAPAEPHGLLDVSHDDVHSRGIGSSDLPVLLELAECRALLRRTTPAPGTFVVVRAFNGVCVQMLWQEDHTVWMETPDPVARVSYGRFGTLAEAEALICQLAEEGSSGLPDHPGAHTVHWH